MPLTTWASALTGTTTAWSRPEGRVRAQAAEHLDVGGAIFQGNCAACHGLDGAGLTGPNLTDESYIHVQKIGDLVDVISKGRNNGAMPAWENRLEPRQVALLATYVASLRGKNRPGREAQGNLIAPWSEK